MSDRPVPRRPIRKAARTLRQPADRGPGRRRGTPKLNLFGVMAKIWSFWLLGKLLAIALAAGSVWLIKTAIVAPEFEATEAIITGGELVPAEELAASLDLGGKNVFLIRSRYLVSLLEAHPAIRSAVVRPSFNGLVHVDMTEREAVAVWDSGSQQVLVDTDGIVLREGSRDLPTVYSVASGRISEGGRVDLSAVRIAARVGSELDGLGLSGGRIVHDPGSGVSIVGPWHRVLLGSSDQLEAKLQAYRTIRSYLDDTGTPAQLVDVRSLDRPYFR